MYLTYRLVLLSSLLDLLSLVELIILFRGLDRFNHMTLPVDIGILARLHKNRTSFRQFVKIFLVKVHVTSYKMALLKLLKASLRGKELVKEEHSSIFSSSIFQREGIRQDFPPQNFTLYGTCRLVSRGQTAIHSRLHIDLEVIQHVIDHE